MQSTRRPFIFGEVLFDRFPDGSVVMGGAPFNVAWHLQAFGQAPLFISRIGNDALGRRIRGAMQEWGLDTAALQLDSERPTGTVEVQFDAGEPSYDIVPDRAYDRISADIVPPGEACLLYHGTLALRATPSAAALSTLKHNCEAPVFLDVNLRAPWWRDQQVHELLADAHWVKLNAEELETLVSGKQSLETKAEQLIEQRDIELLIVTRGGDGATAFRRNEPGITVVPAQGNSVVDTVGAGDAFTSVTILGLLRDWPLQLTMERAQQFASALVRVRGATVQDRSFYQRFIEDWGLLQT